MVQIKSEDIWQGYDVEIMVLWAIAGWSWIATKKKICWELRDARDSEAFRRPMAVSG